MISTLFVLSSINEVFPDSNPVPCVSYYNGKDNFIYVKDSSFHQMMSNIKGGALSIEPLVFTRVFIEKSLFDSCSANTGGAISLSLKTALGVEKVCAFNCFASSNGQFGYCGLETNQQGDFSLFSMTKCSQATSQSRTNGIELLNGNITLKNCNFSANQAYTISTIKSNSRFFDSIYITIAENTAASTGTLDITNNGATTIVNFRYFIFINNYATNNHLQICTRNCTYFWFSIFYGNTNALFYTPLNSYEKVIVCDSYIYHSYLLFSQQNINTTNCTMGDKVIETYKFDHYSTFLCFNMNINELLLNINGACTPAITIPPPPTDCGFETSQINLLKSFKGVIGFFGSLLMLALGKYRYFFIFSRYFTGTF